jgi:hypothetical protein
LNPNRKTNPGCGAKVISKTRTATGFAFSMPVKIAEIRRGV